MRILEVLLLTFCIRDPCGFIFHTDDAPLFGGLLALVEGARSDINLNA